MTEEELKVLSSAFRAELLGIEILRAERELESIYASSRVDLLRSKIDEYKRLRDKARSEAQLSKGNGDGQFEGR